MGKSVHSAVVMRIQLEKAFYSDIEEWLSMVGIKDVPHVGTMCSSLL